MSSSWSVYHIPSRLIVRGIRRDRCYRGSSVEIREQVGEVRFSELVESCNELGRPEIMSWNADIWN